MATDDEHRDELGRLRAAAGRLGLPDDLYRGLPDEYDQLFSFCEGVAGGLRRAGLTLDDYLTTLDDVKGIDHDRVVRLTPSLSPPTRRR